MDIEGEAACAIGPQLLTAEGEKGAGVDIKRTSSHLEANNLLTSDNGESTDNQEQVKLALTISLAKRPRCSGTSWTNCQNFEGRVQWENQLPREGSRCKGRE